MRQLKRRPSKLAAEDFPIQTNSVVIESARGHLRPSIRELQYGRSPFHCGRSMPRHWQQDPNFRTNPSGSRHGRIVPGSDIRRLL